MTDEDVQRIAKAVYDYNVEKQSEGTEFLFQMLGGLVVLVVGLMFVSWMGWMDVGSWLDASTH